MLKPEDFFDLEGFEYKAVFDDCNYVWEALRHVGRFAFDYIMAMDPDCQIAGTIMKGAYVDDKDAVVIGEGTVVEPGAFVQGPCIIGRNCQIRHGAYIRGDVLIGDDCIIGHCSELKNTIMLDTAQCPHFNYVGDSILGRGVNLGAGTRLSNVPVVSMKDPKTGKRPSIKLTIQDTVYDTRLAKFGAILGDGVQTGCNAVTSPGCIIGRDTLVYANLSLKKGYYGPDQIIKLIQQTEIVERR